MGPTRFQLTRYFTLTSLVAFAVLGASLFFLQRTEETYFAAVQRDEAVFFARVQAELLQEQREAAHANLVTMHEAGHVTLTQVFANALWASHLAPLVAQAQAVDAGPCRNQSEARAGDGVTEAQKACIERVRGRLQSLPAFAAVDAPVRALMRGTTVFKIKVYDPRGLTVYSSELAQVGEDKADNAGWRSAMRGKPLSELVHRNQFSAFEGVVYDRALIQSYMPVAGRGDTVAGVFEIYSDVTPMLQQLQAAAARSEADSLRNQQRIEEATAVSQAAVKTASVRLLATICALLVLTYLALLFFVRRGQKVIDREAAAREQAALREQEWHRDKMATMGAMAANISHEVGNPLAIISGLAEEIGHWRDPADINPEFPRMIVEQTGRIANMTRRIDDFASAGRDTLEVLDINQLVQSVCDFLFFDRRFHGTPIDLRLQPGLPACHGIPDHLTEVLMGLLQAYEQGCEGCGASGARLVVETDTRDGKVMIRIGGACEQDSSRCPCPVGDPRMESARRRMEGMGGHIESAGTALELRLSSAAPAP